MKAKGFPSLIIKPDGLCARKAILKRWEKGEDSLTYFCTGTVPTNYAGDWVGETVAPFTSLSVCPAVRTSIRFALFPLFACS